MNTEFKIKDRYDINDLVSVVAVLRAPGGCPWDREQTHQSIKKNFIEETYEAVEAIDKNDMPHLMEELGDVLLQVVMHCRMESEKSGFDFDDVCDAIVKKLVVRHPHVFGDSVAGTTAQALDNWDAVKQNLRGEKTQAESMLSVSRALPALMRAQKVQKKASKVGFDWDSADGAFDKLYEEIDELKKAVLHHDKAEMKDELGDVLFSCVNISRFLELDSEESLSCATDKFVDRFSVVEKLAKESNISLNDAPVSVLDELWNEAKKIKNAKRQTEEKL